MAAISDSGSFVYGAGFKRIKKVENGKTTLYFFKDYEEEYQGGVLSKATKYYFANNMRVVESSSADEVRWYHKDHLGSSSAMSDINGNLILRMAYKPYGEISFSEGIGGVRYTFTGKELDNSDFYYYGARYYDPVMGRFISVDPLEDGLNWYAYCNNNPVVYIDPTGLWAMGCIGIGTIGSISNSIGNSTSGVTSGISSDPSGSTGGPSSSNYKKTIDNINKNVKESRNNYYLSNLPMGMGNSGSGRSPSGFPGGMGNGGFGRSNPLSQKLLK